MNNLYCHTVSSPGVGCMRSLATESVCPYARPDFPCAAFSGVEDPILPISHGPLHSHLPSGVYKAHQFDPIPLPHNRILQPGAISCSTYSDLHPSYQPSHLTSFSQNVLPHRSHPLLPCRSPWVIPSSGRCVFRISTKDTSILTLSQFHHFISARSATSSAMSTASK